MVEENLSEFTKEENIDKIEQIEIKEDKVEVKQDEVKDELNDFFEEFLDKESLFIDKIVLQVKYLPDIILHRTNQMKQLASILAPALKNDKPSNLFIYGKTGTGKTLCMKHTISKMNEISKKRNIPLRIIYLNCKMKKVADTEYRIIAQLAREIGEEVPMTGLPTDEVYNIFINN